MKTLLRHTGSEDENALFPHTSTSEYTCRLVDLSNGDFLNLCIVLADVDMAMANLQLTDPSGTTNVVYAST
jgi:hypothetical protein